MNVFDHVVEMSRKFDDKKATLESLEGLDDVINIQVSEPSNATDEYMRGLSNGLLTAKAIVTDDPNEVKLVGPNGKMDEAQALTRSNAGMGLIQYANDKIALIGGMKTAGLSRTDTHAKLRWMIFVIEGEKKVGYVDMSWNYEKQAPVGIVDLKLEKPYRGQGIGAEVVQALKATFPQMKVHDIKKGAVGFWKKQGAMPLPKDVSRGGKDMQFESINEDFKYEKITFKPVNGKQQSVFILNAKEKPSKSGGMFIVGKQVDHEGGTTSIVQMIDQSAIIKRVPMKMDKTYGILVKESINEEVVQHKYSNVQILAPHDVAQKVIEFGLSIPDEDIYTDPDDPSMGRELVPHITIKWGLTTEDPNEVESLIEDDVQPFQVVLGKVGIFEGDDKPYDVVKIDVDGDALHQLHKRFSTLENGDENPEYVPHLTVAYVKKGSGKKYVGREDFVGVEFGVDCFDFKDQHGNSKQIVLNSNIIKE